MNSKALISTVEVSNCPICDSAERTGIASGHDYEYGTCGNEWFFWECISCRHAWLDPRPADAAIGVIYPTNYYSYDYEKNISTLAVKGKAWLDRRKFSSLRALLPGDATSYLDVGCSTGRFLKLAVETGIPAAGVAGIELDATLVQKLTAEGLQVECARVEDSAILRSRFFDLITMFHVIEHVADPRAVIRALANSLSDGGVLAMETPNRRSLDARLFRNRYWGGYHIPRHWHVFTPDSIGQALEDAGLELLTIRYQTGHSFWLFSFHHLLKYRFGLGRLAQMVHPLHSLPALLAVTVFDIVRAALGMRTSAMLVVARKKRGNT
jgi:SAM-dependent methyltransferase